MPAAKDMAQQRPGGKAVATSSLPFCAEDVASAALEKILKKGGDHLYAKYIDNKSFTFATDMATTNVMCQVEMSNPTHDEGDSASDWEIQC
jgi:hypothetical protein